jgi:arylsulfatase A-like enzyme
MKLRRPCHKSVAGADRAPSPSETAVRFVLPCLIAIAAAWSGAAVAASAPHNVILFVADGLRSGMVTPEHAPAMAALRAQGVDLRNSHAMYPTLTTVNASAIATGHRVGDTGDFGNVLYVGAATTSASPSPFAPVEDDEVLGGLNAQYGGDYLGETSLMEAARHAGFSTAAIGKIGPIAIQDVTDRDGKGSLIIDDMTGIPGGFPLPADVVDAIKAQGLAPIAEDRGLNGSPGTYNSTGVWVANVQQQDWFTKVATAVVLPRFKATHAPFFMVFWSRDPDGTQHNQGDSLNTLTPGIDGPTSLAGIRNADNDLASLRATLVKLGLDKTTDIVVIADHGFSVISKQSATSPAAKAAYEDVPPGFLPFGFLAMDMAKALDLPLYDGVRLPIEDHPGHPRTDGQLLGRDPKAPDVAIATNGGSDLIYLPKAGSGPLARKIVDWLTRQDYTGAIFAADALGEIPGALPLSRIGLEGTARTIEPSIIVSFRSASTGCAEPELCAAEIADTPLQQGQGMHGSFSRADTHNFMAAAGPDFRQGYRDPTPVSNADVAPTLAHILGLSWPSAGDLKGRVMTEALADGAPTPSTAKVVASAPAANGFVTTLDMQEAGGEPYFDAAGKLGQVVGLHP